MIKSVIIDDEERGISALKGLLKISCPEVEVIDTARNITRGAELIKELKPDLVFLDVEMPGGNGFQLLKEFDEIYFEIIFVTAFHEYAIKALRFSALDYLLKPVKVDELLEAIGRLKNKKENNQRQVQYKHLKTSLDEGNPFHKIVLNTNAEQRFVTINDIIYCKADESYTIFYIHEQPKLVVSKPLKDFEDMLDGQNFFRIHKSFLVNMYHIEVISKDSMVVMSNKDELPVSYRKRIEFNQLLKDR